MIKEFNTYLKAVPIEFWRDYCREEGEPKQLKRGNPLSFPEKCVNI